MELSQLQIRIARSESLAVLPQVVINALRLFEDPRASAHEIQQTLRVDAGISAKILRVANSPYFGGAKVDTITRAVSVLGMNAIRVLVVSVGFRQVIGEESGAESFDRLRFWRHCLAVGSISRILGKMLVPTQAEQLYTAGIMHDIGMLVLDRFAPCEFEDALSLVRTERVPLQEAERRVLGFDHTEVGEVLAQTWNLSPTICNAVRYHHEPLMDVDCPTSTNIVAASNAMATAAGFENGTAAPGDGVTQAMASALNLPLEQFDVVATVAATEIQKALESFDPVRIGQAA